MLTQLTLRTKLLLSLLMMGLIPFIIIGYFATHKAKTSLSDQAFKHLESVREIKKSQLENFLIERQGDIQSLTDMLEIFRQQSLQKVEAIQEVKKSQLEQYFEERNREVQAWSQDEFIVEALGQFDSAFGLEGLQVGGLIWSSIEDQIGQELSQYGVGQGNYEDLLLINKAGDVVYSTLKGEELGNNVLVGTLANSQLRLAFAQAVTGGMAIQDFAPYALTQDSYQAFMAAPLFRAGEIIGGLVLRLSPSAINHIVQERKNMYGNGESILVGRLADQTVYRSDSIFDKKGRIGEPYLGTAANLGLAGNSGKSLIEDENGHLNFIFYSPLNISGLQWIILTILSLEEVFTIENKLQGQENFFERYIQYYDYQDLLLVHPRGKIFYTVRHKTDYGANVLAGQWASSELAKSVRTVLNTGQIIFSDYVPYAPNHDEPTAFIAHPLLDEKGQVEVIIVLELNKNVTNKIMLQRAGMGETGEAYLVGPDQLLRSDTFLDQIHHSMSASFSNPEQGRVNTLSVELALQGNSGKHLILNYQAIPVLSTYAPVQVGATTWALVTEMSETEAFAKIDTLQWIIAAVASLGMLMIGGAAVWLTSGLIDPIKKIVFIINGLSKGQLPETVDFPMVKAEDEVMVMQRSVYQLSAILQNIVSHAQKTVEAARNGDLSQRIAADSLEGFMHALGENINALIGTMDEVMGEIRQVMSALAEGRLNQHMRENYRGMYAEVSQFTRVTMGNLQKILSEIEWVVEHAGRGSLDGRIDLGNKCGFSETLSSRVNALLDIQQRFTRDVSILLGNLKDGDLSQPIETEYVGCFEQVKLNANLALENLVGVLWGIKATVTVIRNQVEGIEEGNAALSHRTEEQAAFLEETAASMEQMTATVQQNAHNAQVAEQLATSATQIAKQGTQAINNVIDKMGQINHSSQKIFAISDVINEIAFQTNLLALNASVEAARAGEQGRGFAVVATEVRNLAQRSASAAKEINQLIQSSVKDVQVGSQLVNGAGETMENILVSIQKVTDIVAEISAASIEQSEGIKQVNVAMSRIDGMTQQNNLLVEKVTTSIRELSKQANYLQTTLEQFKLPPQ